MNTGRSIRSPLCGVWGFVILNPCSALCGLVSCAALLLWAGCGPMAVPASAVGGGGAVPASRPASRPGGGMVPIFIALHPADATVKVDGKVARLSGPGTRGGRSLSLHPGLHRFEFSKSGHRTFRIELVLRQNTEKLVVRLKPLE